MTEPIQKLKNQYVYAMTNSLYKDHVKIGMTCNIQERLDRANSTDEFIPQTFRQPYNIEYAIKVSDMKNIEDSIQKYFNEFNVNESKFGSQEWFKIPLDNVIKLFELLVSIGIAEWYDLEYYNNEDEEEEKTIIEENGKTTGRIQYPMKDYIDDGTLMRMKIDHNVQFEHKYCSDYNQVIYNGKPYTYTTFATNYYMERNPSRNKDSGLRPWIESTQCFIDNMWIDSNLIQKKK
jgi:hypothetical protein